MVAGVSMSLIAGGESLERTAIDGISRAFNGLFLISKRRYFVPRIVPRKFLRFDFQINPFRRGVLQGATGTIGGFHIVLIVMMKVALERSDVTASRE
jgi:hypothetical protein